MATIVECPECQARFRYDAARKGARLRCTKCNAEFVYGAHDLEDTARTIQEEADTTPPAAPAPDDGEEPAPTVPFGATPPPPPGPEHPPVEPLGPEEIAHSTPWVAEDENEAATLVGAFDEEAEEGDADATLVGAPEESILPPADPAETAFEAATLMGAPTGQAAPGTESGLHEDATLVGAPNGAQGGQQSALGTLSEAGPAVCPRCGATLSEDPLSPADSVHCSQCGTLVGSEDFQATITGPAPASGAGTRDMEEMQTLWGDTLTGDAKPEMTLKKDRTMVQGEAGSVLLSVTVRPRNIAEAKAAPASGLDYEIKKILGQGGMGVVYAARQTSVDRPIAIKMMKGKAAHDPNSRAKFLAEAVVEGDLDHPNIVPVHDLGTDEEGNLFYAMKQVRGDEWSSVIGEKGEQENLEVLLKVCDAIAFAHSRDVIHRDLKPENVMIGGFGEVLVMDWGLAASVGPRAKADPITKETSLAGTPAYMAPEMADAQTELIGFGSDIYLLGAILYEAVTGKRPHTGGTVLECLVNAANNEIVPTDIESELVDIALKAMATAPSDRYPSVTDFAQAIRDYQDHHESIVLAEKAEKHLETARTSRDYDDFINALYGFRQAVELWEENEEARTGVGQASLEYADCAFEKGDLDMARGLLDPDDPDHAELAEAVEAAIADRERRQKRLRRMYYVLGIGTVIFIAVVSIALVMVTSAQAETKRALGEAEEKRALAVKREEEAQVARADAEQRRKEAQESERAAKQAEERANEFLEKLNKAQGNEEEMKKLLSQSRQHLADAERKRELERKKRDPSAWALPPEAARQKQATAAQEAGLEVERTIDLGEGTRLALRLVPPGQFVMGSPEGEIGRSNEEVLHPVVLSQPFYLAATEMTVAQWNALSSETRNGAPTLPVTDITWNRIQEEVLAALNRKAPAGWTFRLPTEAEWEYACRAGTITPFASGAGAETLAAMAWFGDNSGGALHPVADGVKPNAWGLFDMHGNAAEWCQDTYDQSFYYVPKFEDPVNTADGPFRVTRGGGWVNLAIHCRSAYRSYAHAANDYDFLGLRVALVRLANEE